MAEELATLPKPEIPAAGRIGFKEALGVSEPFLQRKAELQPQITAAEGDIAKAKQAQAETLSSGRLAAQQQFGKEETAARGAYEGKLEAEPLPAFVPTKDTAQDIAGLFSVIGVMGMLIGGSGKMAGQRAMGAMNGMLEGYRKGRGDLYKQQRNEFDANFKTMLQKHQEFRKEMEDAVKLASTNKEAGMAAAELAATKAGSEIGKAELRKGNLLGFYKTLSESETLYQNALKLEGKAREAEIAAAAREREAAQRERRHREDMAQKERQHRETLKAQTERALAKGSGGAGAVAGQVERMTNAMTQVSGAIQSVADLQITTTAPLFGQKDFKGLFTAPLSALNQKISKETSQMLQGRMVGVARNLASLETGGAATGLAGLTDSIQAGISIPAGAKMHVALDRLAEMRRIVEDASRAALASPKYSPEQKQLIRENVAIVEEAIPFTLKDVNEAVIAGEGRSPKVPKADQKLSFTDYVNKYGVGSSKERAAAASSLTEEEKAELAELRARHGRTQ
jgi:hypothetical protein